MLTLSLLLPLLILFLSLLIPQQLTWCFILVILIEPNNFSATANVYKFYLLIILQYKNKKGKLIKKYKRKINIIFLK